MKKISREELNEMLVQHELWLKNEGGEQLNLELRDELKDVLNYMDNILENVSEDKITEFAHSDYFNEYKKLFSDLDIL
jgi:hypothetical protein